MVLRSVATLSRNEPDEHAFVKAITLLSTGSIMFHSGGGKRICFSLNTRFDAQERLMKDPGNFVRSVKMAALSA